MPRTERGRPFLGALGRWGALRRQLACMTLLLPVFVGTYYLSYLLRFEWRLGPDDWERFSTTVLCVVLIKLVVFGWFRIYHGWGLYVTFYDLLALVQAATSSLLLIVLSDRFLLLDRVIPRSVFLLDWGTTIVVVGGVRALARAVHERKGLLFLSADKTPALIVGANETGEALLRAIIRNGNLTYHVVGFLDDDPARLGTRIGGVPVIGSVSETCRLAERHGVREVLIVAGELSGRQMRKLVEETRQHAIGVKVLPSYEQLINGRLAIRPSPVSIHDLLRREPVQLEMENLVQWLDGRTLLVTGSAGSIGSEICRQLLRFAPERLVLVDRSETGQFFLEQELRRLAPNARIELCIADLLDEPRMRQILNRYQPDIVFHAAAYKHVPLMEAHPGEAVKNIILATRQLADLAIGHGVETFVMISTDKAVNPTSVMGACKRVAETYVQSLTGLSPTRFVTVRFGNVLDSAGSVVQVFREQIAGGGPVTVTDPRMERYFMTIPEAARLVIQAGAIGNGGEILVLDMGAPIRILDLATDMIRLSGLNVGEDIEIEFIGLRPGEKLFEELYAQGERRLPTRHPKIAIADRQAQDSRAVLEQVEQLGYLADNHPEAIFELLWQTAPGRPVGERLEEQPREQRPRIAA